MLAKVETHSKKTNKEHLELSTEIMIDGDVAGIVRKVKAIVSETSQPKLRIRGLRLASNLISMPAAGNRH